MAEDCSASSTERAKDWASHWRTLGGLWGLPVLAMVGGAFMEPMARAAIWTIALTWMGVACLMNARRCHRTHCRFTGPFYLAMALLVPLFASGLLPLGSYGWHILAGETVLGTAALWWGTERKWGMFSR